MRSLCDVADSEDDTIMNSIHLPFRQSRKKQLMKCEKADPFFAPVIVGRQQMLGAVEANKNKRKTPSPVVGREPAKISSNEESMDTEDTLRTEETWNTTRAGYDSDDNTLPSPGRRVSLSPISRRLTIQFDSISFFSPVKPSRAKRRKTFDTSASSL